MDRQLQPQRRDKKFRRTEIKITKRTRDLYAGSTSRERSTGRADGSRLARAGRGSNSRSSRRLNKLRHGKNLLAHGIEKHASSKKRRPVRSGRRRGRSTGERDIERGALPDGHGGGVLDGRVAGGGGALEGVAPVGLVVVVAAVVVVDRARATPRKVPYHSAAELLQYARAVGAAGGGRAPGADGLHGRGQQEGHAGRGVGHRASLNTPHRMLL